ncbi:MAG: UDP-glucose--hexose-1-phosphate uridylyltransferase [Clostridia bacterium]|nr:UDP-glucose--hexose-1-phosphate uridylyltransferase [Clostridia bacterium]
MVNLRIRQLVDYALREGLIAPADETYSINRLLFALRLEQYTPPAETWEIPPLAEILGGLCDYAVETGLIEADTVTHRDLFDTELMGLLTPRPSEVIARFSRLMDVSPEAATDDYYAFSRATNYIRTDRIARDRKWKTPSPYGEMDITINLSKPEKDPLAIAAAKKMKASGYPACALCAENEGYAGTLNAAPRANHRLIPIALGGEDWYLQYSPYVYYPEHCIALSGNHAPMRICRDTFARLLDFVTLFPHYFIGSNADLPIVGGSILTHDHMQGGHYTFAMARAERESTFTFPDFPDITAGIVRWPMSVLRLSSNDRDRMIDLCDRILCAWRTYSDPAAMIFAETDGEPHNTVTPIARVRDGAYEVDLVLRNNLTTPEHPLGLYHPHRELHNIKKENIGLIEVMGLAVLPARLKAEMARLADCILSGGDPAEDDTIAHHAAWFAAFRDRYTFTAENVQDILEQEIGHTFVRVLEQSGVYRCDAEGRAAFWRFIDSLR